MESASVWTSLELSRECARANLIWVILRRLFIVTLTALLVCCPDVRAYSLLSHEAIIDSAWDAGIKPLLLARFPNATPDELRQAHA